MGKARRPAYYWDEHEEVGQGVLAGLRWLIYLAGAACFALSILTADPWFVAAYVMWVIGLALLTLVYGLLVAMLVVPAAFLVGLATRGARAFGRALLST